MQDNPANARTTAGENHFEVQCRFTGTHLGEVSASDPSTFCRSLALVGQAQHQWAQTSFAGRKTFFADLLEMLLEHSGDLAHRLSSVQGISPVDALTSEILPACEALRFVLREGAGILAEGERTSGLMGHKRVSVHYQPLGIIAIAGQSFAAFGHALGLVIPALFAGNAVVLQPSWQAAFETEQLVEFVRKVLRKHGHGEHLISAYYQDTDVISPDLLERAAKVYWFGKASDAGQTLAHAGSYGVALVPLYRASNLAIVCEDAHLHHAVDWVARAMCFASGRTERRLGTALIFSEVYDEFLDLLSRRLERTHGQRDGMVQQLSRPFSDTSYRQFVEEAQKHGARVHFEGHDAASRFGGLAPTILTNIDTQWLGRTDCCQAPLLCTAKVRDEVEAVFSANAVPQGVEATVFTRSTALGQRISHGLKASCVQINDYNAEQRLHAVSLASIRGAAFGRFHGAQGLQAMAIETATVRERIAVVDPFTNFYEPHISFEMARAALCSVYTHDASRRSKAIFDTARSVVSVIRGKLNGDEDGDPSDDR